MNPSPHEHFPEAQVHERGDMVSVLRRSSSRLWIVTGICLVVAVVLMVSANRNRGIQIAVRFQHGHGIEPGDVLRHRGIEVGEIISVKLDDDLATVVVKIVLEPASAGLARQGSQFWIARPDVSLTGIRDLETIVGGRFLAVVPGPDDAEPLTSFTGLEVAPTTTERAEGGLEITLESVHRRGVRPGAPVLYRGHKVGQIVSLGLSPDASRIEARAYIEPAFKRLVRDNTVFWSTSGVKANFSISGGFELSAETIETIAA